MSHMNTQVDGRVHACCRLCCRASCSVCCSVHECAGCWQMLIPKSQMFIPKSKSHLAKRHLADAQCVVVCVVMCVVVCCSNSHLADIAVCCCKQHFARCVAECHNVLQCVTVKGTSQVLTVLQCLTVCCSKRHLAVAQWVAVCYGVLQCVVVFCSKGHLADIDTQKSHRYPIYYSICRESSSEVIFSINRKWL